MLLQSYLKDYEIGLEVEEKKMKEVDERKKLLKEQSEKNALEFRKMIIAILSNAESKKRRSGAPKELMFLKLPMEYCAGISTSSVSSNFPLLYT